MPLPTFEKQAKIVQVIDAIQEKIKNNTKLNGYLEELMRAEFKRRFIVNAERSGWKIGTFSELVSSTLSGDWGKEEPLGSNTEKVYCMRGADIPEVKAGNKGKMPIRYILPKNYANKHFQQVFKPPSYGEKLVKVVSFPRANIISIVSFSENRQTYCKRFIAVFIRHSPIKCCIKRNI